MKPARAWPDPERRALAWAAAARGHARLDDARAARACARRALAELDGRDEADCWERVIARVPLDDPRTIDGLARAARVTLRAAMELVVLVGLQGAGKSSFYRARFAATHAHVSKDHFPHNRRPARRQAQLVEQAFAAGRDVVVDNTNATREDRAALVALARAHGARVVCYHLDAPIADCLARNGAREGKARVPDVALFATAKRLVPPSLAEGFDALYAVRIGPAGFEVRPLAPATPCADARSEASS